MKLIIFNKMFLGQLILAVFIQWILGSNHLLNVWLPLGPTVVFWNMSSPLMNKWNRVGLCYVLGFIVCFLAAVVGDTLIKNAGISLQIFLTFSIMGIFSWRSKIHQEPIAKLIIISLILALFVGFYDKLYLSMPAFDPSQAGKVTWDNNTVTIYGNGPNLFGKIMQKLFYLPHLILFYGIALYFARKPFSNLKLKSADTSHESNHNGERYANEKE